MTGEPGLRFPADRGIAGSVLREGHTIRLDDAQHDPRFNPEVDRRTGYRTRTLMTVPVRGWADWPIGVLTALNKHGGELRRPRRGPGRRPGRPGRGGDPAPAPARPGRGTAAVGARPLGRPDDPARPDASPSPEDARLDVAGWNLPADETGGDFFDFQALDDGRLALTVADVAGHGIGPALLVAECRAFIRATIVQTRDPARLVEQVDVLLADDLPEDRFITLFFGLYDPPGRASSATPPPDTARPCSTARPPAASRNSRRTAVPWESPPT